MGKLMPLRSYRMTPSARLNDSTRCHQLGYGLFFVLCPRRLSFQVEERQVSYPLVNPSHYAKYQLRWRSFSINEDE